MKILVVILYITFLALTFDKVQNANLKLSTDSSAKIETYSEAQMKSKIETEVLSKVKAKSNMMVKTKTSSKAKVAFKAKVMASSQAKTAVKAKTEVKAKTTSEAKATSNFKMSAKARLKLALTSKSKKRSESVMEYLNKMQGGRKNNTSPNKKRNITINIVPQENPDVILEEEEKLNLLKEGWLEISSPGLLNVNKFPKLTFPDNSEHQIPTEQDYFRVNEGFDPLRNPDSPPTAFYFWMRLSWRNLYYSISKPSINVVGNIPVKDIINAYVLKEFAKSDKCLKVDDTAYRDWTLCAQTKTERNEWVCKIRALKQLEEENACLKRLLSDEAIIVQKKVTQPIILIPQASPMCNENFNYENNGKDWDCDCKNGREQSPIDLPLPEMAIRSPVKPIFEYEEVKVRNVVTSGDGSYEGTENLSINIDSHVLKIKHDNFGKIVTMDGSLYTAQEIVFHTPAEHTINGKKYDMEMQIIHFGQTSGDLAKQIILSFVFERKAGFYNKFIDDIDFFTLPNPLSKSRDLENNLFIPKIFYNSRDDEVPIMKPFSFYTYQGSLTAPPCTERTIVYVAAEPIKIGTTAIQLFEEALRMPDLEAIPSGDIIIDTKSTYNNREVQNLNGRNVFYYDAKADMCMENPKPKKRKQGHYERIDAEAIKYYYVTGEKPSGMAGAFVVSKNEAIAKGLLVS